MTARDERVEAAAEVLESRSENDDWEWCLGDAQAALAASDVVLRSPAAVERVARALPGCSAFDSMDDYRRAARAAIAALLDGEA